MERDPGSVWAPLPESGAPDGHRKDQFIVHSVGAARQTARQVRDNWFARTDVQVESTFIVGWGPHDPTLQIMHASDRADANGSSNRRAISVEVVGDGDGGYNPWQRGELIRLGRWARAHHPIPARICPAHDQGGFGWHVMFGAPGPWTTVRGKTCPDGARDKLRSTQLRADIFPAVFGPETTQHPHSRLAQEDDMPLAETDRPVIERAVAQVLRQPEFRQELARVIADVVWGWGVHFADERQPATLVMRDIAHHARAAAAQGEVNPNEVAAAVVSQLATSQDLLAALVEATDRAQVEATLAEAARRLGSTG